MRHNILPLTLGIVAFLVYLFILPGWEWLPGGYRTQLGLLLMVLGGLSRWQSLTAATSLILVSGPFLMFLLLVFIAYAANGIFVGAPLLDVMVVLCSFLVGFGAVRLGEIARRGQTEGERKSVS